MNESLLQYKLYLYMWKSTIQCFMGWTDGDEQDVNIVFREADDVSCCDFIGAKKKLIILELINTALLGMMSVMSPWRCVNKLLRHFQEALSLCECFK